MNILAYKLSLKGIFVPDITKIQDTNEFFKIHAYCCRFYDVTEL